MTKVLVFDSKLTVLYKDQLTTGSENFFKVEYEFNDETWKDYKKHAVFFQVVTQPKLEMEMPDTNIVEIPNELLIADLPLFIGVYGVHKTDGTILSTNFKAVPVEYGAFSGDIQSFENVAAAIVRSVDTKIKFIRLNEEGEFQYSTDGVNWRLVTDTIDYQAIFNRLDELDKGLEKTNQELQKTSEKLPNDKLVFFYKASEENDDDFVIETEYSYEKKRVFAFVKRNFKSVPNYPGWYRLSITKNTHGLENVYLSGFVITSMINKNENININGQNNASCYDYIGVDGTVHIYINIDLSANGYTAYSGKIILKGE